MEPQIVSAVKDLVLGAGLEPACLSAYAPQTYVSAIPPPERNRQILIRNAGKQEVRTNQSGNQETKRSPFGHDRSPQPVFVASWFLDLFRVDFLRDAR